MTSRRSSGSMRAESAVEPTKSENITVTWRRSARSSGEALGALDVVAASAEGALPLASVRRAAIASSSLRRCPSAATPSSFRSSAVRLGRTVSSISFSRNAASYFPRPRLRSQTTMSMRAPTIRGGAHHRLSEHCVSSTTPEAAVVAAGVDRRSERYTLPVELGSLSPLVGRVVNAAAARFSSRALVSERATNQSGCCAHKAS